MSAPRVDRTHSVHWLYRCFDKDGRLVYVGTTTNLFNRLKTHRAQTWWAPQVAKVRAVVYPNGAVARIAEREAIAAEVPRWNKAHKWAGRHNWTQADWEDWLTILDQEATLFSGPLRAAMKTYRSLFGVDAPERFARAADAIDQERRAAQERWAADMQRRTGKKRLRAVSA